MMILTGSMDLAGSRTRRLWRSSVFENARSFARADVVAALLGCFKALAFPKLVGESHCSLDVRAVPVNVITAQ
jgi:hypothetical protein